METRADARVLSTGQMSAPCLCINVEMSTGAPSIPPQTSSHAAACAWLLVSVHTEAVGSLVVEVPPDGLTREQVARAVMAELGEKVAPRLGNANDSPFLTSRRQVLSHAPKITIMVCTRERPERLESCLHSLLAQEYPNFSVLVVDNFPVTDRTQEVVDRLSSPAIEYVVEPRKGLSRAKNTALGMIADGIVASIDDDEIADPHWLTELARGFHEHPEADAVSGVMVPGELETWAQVWFEQYGGHNKLRGFTPAVFSPATAKEQSPLYPLPSFGSGGNVAFRRSSLARIGGFDVTLGPGTASMSNEDTRIFTDLLCAGGTIVYQPTAVTQHFHRRSMEELREQMLGYGVGLTAFYASLVLDHPRRVPQLLRLVPTAYCDLFGKEGLQGGGLPSDFPAELLRTKRRGMFIGPVSYLRARAEAARGARDSEGER